MAMLTKMLGIFGLIVYLFLIPINGDIETGYTEVLEEYERFMTSLDHFRNSMDEVCKELEEYEKLKVSLDTLLVSRDELCKQKRIHRDCAGIKEEFPDAEDGVYRIKPRDGKQTFLVFCDMTEEDGDWTVIQRRQNGSEDFYRTWFEYMDGFGNLTGEFWLGNEKIHRLTSHGSYELRVDLEDADGKKAYAKYSSFLLGNMSEFYYLNISGYSGNAGDRLTYHNTMRFSAKNLDLDKDGGNCAKQFHGAWWYNACLQSKLNGLYNGTSYHRVWWDGLNVSRKTTLKTRPVH